MKKGTVIKKHPKERLLRLIKENFSVDEVRKDLLVFTEVSPKISLERFLFRANRALPTQAGKR